jgi:hypothetical protein
MTEQIVGSNQVWIAAAMMVLAAFAGCAGDQAVDDGEPGSDPGGESSQTESARSSYTSAMSVLDQGAEDADRVGMSMSFEPSNESDDESGSMDALYDKDAKLTVMTLTGAFAEAGDGQQSQNFDQLLAGQVAKTSFFGFPPEVFSFYNESAEKPDGFTSIDASPDTGSSSDDDSGPTEFLKDLSEDPPEDAEFETSEVTHEGQAAAEITATYTVNASSYDVRVVSYTDPQRPALVEGSVDNPSDPSKAGSFSMTFTYGEDATHEHEEAVKRVEAMTIASEEAKQNAMAQGGNQRFTNHTVQPSQNAGSISLEEVEVHVRESGDGQPSGEQSSVLEMPAEEGEASGDNVTVRFLDEDDNGAVSPGDRIVLEDENLDDGKSYSAVLHDEKTGFNVTPAPSIAAIAALVGLVALLRRD